jgi:carboxypeptidase Q
VIRAIALVVSIALGIVAPVSAQEPVDQRMIAAIKAEGFQNSQVMETLSFITDVHGPRLSGSPNLKAAGDWCVKRMSEWGLANARLEPWGTFGRGWSLEKLSVEMVDPQYTPLNAFPKAWTPSTKGVVSGQPVLVDVKSKADFDKYKGKLKGAIVMNGSAPKPKPRADAGTRFEDRELAEMAGAIDPGSPKTYQEEDKEWVTAVATQDEITKFFNDEGTAVLLEPSARDFGIVRVATQTYTLNTPLTFTSLVVGREHYGRIARLLEKKIPVRLAINVESVFHEQDVTGYNVIAEIPGTDPLLGDQVVMLGAHLDSWHAGTGATDNAAGCVAMMEALRILKAIGAKPRRTIRVALWSGEEQGYYGSLGYVKKHFGDPATLKLLPEHEKLSAYFNLDNGTGKIRGVYLQGNEAVRPIFEAYLAPFHYLGATTLAVANTGGTDHMPFEAIGLPGFQFIQDSIEYETRTHHTNVDVYEAVSEEDLKQAAVIIATFAYHTAIRDEMLPREAFPKPQKP